MCSLAKGSSTGGDPQGNGLTTAPSFRKLLEDAQPFIVGGQDAPEGRFPYACSLKALGSRIHNCGGTLIAPGWVLTAAHCLIGKDSLGPTPVVHVGAFKIDDYSSEEVTLAVEAIIHESYTGNVEDGFDVALLRLKKPFNIQPAAVAQSGQGLGEGQLLATAGWGRKSNGGPFPKVLQLADQVAYVGNKNCQQQWPKLKDSMLCAFSNSQAVCDGDSGGPLLIADSKGGGNITSGDPALDLVVGIVSFGPEGCDSTKPDVYTRVSSFQEWMDEKMRESPPQTTPMEKCGRDCDQLDEDLFTAAGSGETNEVKEPISKEADVSSSQGELEYALLHFAAQEGHVDIAEKLIEAGANVDAQDGEGVTALSVAAFNGNLDVAKVLVKAGATVDLKTDKGFTPLIIAAELNKLGVAQFLLESGASIDAQNEEGKTALYLAAQNGHVDVVKLLVGGGATVDLKTDKGFTPLIIAAELNNLEVAKFLLESGADVNAGENSTSLHLAANAGSPKLVRLLLDGGAEVDARDLFDQTPIFWAVMYGDEAIEVLKNAGADLSIKNKAGAKTEDVICLCLKFEPPNLPCREGTCGEGEIERIEAILKR